MKKIALLLAAALTVTGCRSQGGKPKPTRAATFEGVELTLNETIGGTVVPHRSDRENENRTQFVDVNGKLRLSFTPPPERGKLSANPEWQKLDRAIAALDEMLAEYRRLAKIAEKLPDQRTEGTDKWQEEVDAFQDYQVRVLRTLIDEDGVLTEDEFTNAIIGGDAYAAIASNFNAKQEALRVQAAKFEEAKDQYEVTVRATIDPQVGKRQQLQIPRYFTIDDDTGSLESSNIKRAAQFRKLKVEYDAANELANAVRELQAKNGEVEEVLKSMVEKAGAKLEAVLDELGAQVKALPDQLKLVIETPSVATPGTPEATRLKADLTRLKNDIDTVLAAVASAEALLKDFEQLNVEALLGLTDGNDVVTRLTATGSSLRTFHDSVVGAAENVDGWDVLLPRIVTDAGQIVLDAAETQAAPVLEQLKTGLLDDLESAKEEVVSLLPETAKAFERISPTFQRGSQLLASVDNLQPSTGTEIPHKLGELPDAVIDLSKTALTHGDDLTLSVRIWEIGDPASPPQEGTQDPEPVETFDYSMKAINAGWVWSGDLIFTKAEDGPASDSFTTNAGVSREWRFFDRNDPGSSMNWWRPGLGFHAAQLNQDPDTSTEFGVGVTGSLWDGLVRVGYGYNVSIDDDETYYFFGFGVISALDRLSVLTGKDEE